MLIKIQFESQIPIYKQLKNQIIEGIAAGELKPGESMPSVRKMAEDIGINLHTVNKTYKILKNEGILSTHRRKKVVVNSLDQMHDSDFIYKVKDHIRPIIAKSICKGIDQEQFNQIASQIYNEINNGDS